MDDSIPQLTATEVRVLGSLIEKAVTTPDYYPLSLNALTNACNQLTNREPVMSLDDGVVSRAVDSLREKRFATSFHGAESRVAKFKHTLTDAILLTPAEVAVLCVLFLRGPQTIGELRTRGERFFPFEALTEVEETLQGLATRTPEALVVKLPRQPGMKEPRYTHLLSGPIEAAFPTAVPAPVDAAASSISPESARIAALEAEAATLRGEFAELQRQFAEFRKQFE